MNVSKVLKQLSIKYPKKKIIKNINQSGVVCEILCEIEPASSHPEYSLAIAVIDHSPLHIHKNTTEKYKILKGSLRIFKGFKEYNLRSGNEIVIEPGEIHSSIGRETWIEAYSEPGWTIKDHILLHDIMQKYNS